MKKELNNGTSANNPNKKRNSLTNEELIELFKRMKSGDSEARDKIILSNVGLVDKVVKGFNDTKMSYEDMMEAGKIGLINAVDGYDLNKGNKFSTYAYRVIKNEIINAISEDTLIRIKSQNKKLQKYYEVKDKLFEDLGREPTEEEIKKKLDGILTEKDLKILDDIKSYSYIKSLSKSIDDEGTTLEDLIGEEDMELTKNSENRYLYSIIYEASKTLSPRVKQVFDMAFIEHIEDKEIADKLGLTLSHIQDMKIRAIRRIKRYYRIININNE